ncbi:hypothetical protein K466DRAFT_604269 [Polyporus arcularius HHB13444]|uniref:Uncharacterized protein n=1 Tax=Polyporus arcularius HHB13444 TaxID=1314778 RepID=A0A5C3NY78_9APHY|nr:hypothetical protein K466DRAFT_604269 [Polyporus arcularius HHB13444]
MSTDKVKMTLGWPEPRKVKDIWSFPRFANFYLPKNFPWNFSNACCNALNTLKKASTMAPVLYHWEPD